MCSPFLPIIFPGEIQGKRAAWIITLAWLQLGQVPRVSVQLHRGRTMKLVLRAAVQIFPRLCILGPGHRNNKQEIRQCVGAMESHWASQDCLYKFSQLAYSANLQLLNSTQLTRQSENSLTISKTRIENWYIVSWETLYSQPWESTPIGHLNWQNVAKFKQQNKI